MWFLVWHSSSCFNDCFVSMVSFIWVHFLCSCPNLRRIRHPCMNTLFSELKAREVGLCAASSVCQRHTLWIIVDYYNWKSTDFFLTPPPLNVSSNKKLDLNKYTLWWDSASAQKVHSRLLLFASFPGSLAKEWCIQHRWTFLEFSLDFSTSHILRVWVGAVLVKITQVEY